MPAFNGMNTTPNNGFAWGQPNWVNGPSQTQQPYPPNFQQSSQGMQVVQQPPAQFVGRYVDDISNVMPNEVPMDGRMALFPKKDLTEVYLKGWNANGEMKTFRYILDQSLMSAPAQTQETDISKILDRLDQLEEQIKTNTGKPKPKNEGSGK